MLARGSQVQHARRCLGLIGGPEDLDSSSPALLGQGVIYTPVAWCPAWPCRVSALPNQAAVTAVTCFVWLSAAGVISCILLSGRYDGEYTAYHKTDWSIFIS